MTGSKPKEDKSSEKEEEERGADMKHKEEDEKKEADVILSRTDPPTGTRVTPHGRKREPAH